MSKKYVSWMLYAKFQIGTLSGETFCLPEILLSILNFVLRVTYCFLHTAEWPTTDVLGMYCYFPIIWLVNFV